MLTKDQCKVQDMVTPYAAPYAKSRNFSFYFNNLFPNRSGIHRVGEVKLLYRSFDAVMIAAEKIISPGGYLI
jgi:hypothetical protein